MAIWIHLSYQVLPSYSSNLDWLWLAWLCVTQTDKRKSDDSTKWPLVSRALGREKWQRRCFQMFFSIEKQIHIFEWTSNHTITNGTFKPQSCYYVLLCDLVLFERAVNNAVIFYSCKHRHLKYRAITYWCLSHFSCFISILRHILTGCPTVNYNI